jgi:hypothetical protein
LAQPSSATLADPRLELFGQKIVGHGQLFHLPIINFRVVLAATLKYTGRTFQGRTLSTVYHRRVNAKPARQPSDRLFTLQRLKQNHRFELSLSPILRIDCPAAGRMVLPFRHL